MGLHNPAWVSIGNVVSHMMCQSNSTSESQDDDSMPMCISNSQDDDSMPMPMYRSNSHSDAVMGRPC